MPYADDSAVISNRLNNSVRKTVVVIATMCTAFDLTVSEATADIIMYLLTTGVSDSASTFSIEAADPSYIQEPDLVYHEGNVSHDADTSIRNAWCIFQKYRPSSPLVLKGPKAECRRS